MTEDEKVGQHYHFNGHEFEQTLEDSKGQGSLACCSSPWIAKESDMTEQLNKNTHLITDSQNTGSKNSQNRRAKQTFLQKQLEISIFCFQ